MGGNVALPAGLFYDVKLRSLITSNSYLIRQSILYVLISQLNIRQRNISLITLGMQHIFHPAFGKVDMILRRNHDLLNGKIPVT